MHVNKEIRYTILIVLDAKSEVYGYRLTLLWSNYLIITTASVVALGVVRILSYS